MILTAAQFETYPFEEDKRYELDEGRLIVTDRPPYRHNRVSCNLLRAVGSFLADSEVGEAFISENVYALSGLTCLSPDLTVILGDRRRELEHATVIRIVPDIVAEVLCEDDTVHRMHRKLNQYFEAGVKEVWLIDPEAREIEIWTGPALPAGALSGGAVLESPLLPGLALPLDELFS